MELGLRDETHFLPCITHDITGTVCMIRGPKAVPSPTRAFLVVYLPSAKIEVFLCFTRKSRYVRSFYFFFFFFLLCNMVRAAARRKSLGKTPCLVSFLFQFWLSTNWRDPYTLGACRSSQQRACMTTCQLVRLPRHPRALAEGHMPGLP